MGLAPDKHREMHQVEVRKKKKKAPTSATQVSRDTTTKFGLALQGHLHGLGLMGVCDYVTGMMVAASKLWETSL
jgi:hypothetical protein